MIDVETHEDSMSCSSPPPIMLKPVQVDVDMGGHHSLGSAVREAAGDHTRHHPIQCK